MKRFLCLLLGLTILLFSFCPAYASASNYTVLCEFDSKYGIVNGLAQLDGMLVATTDMNKYIAFDPYSEDRLSTYPLGKDLLAADDSALTAQWGVIQGDDGIYMVFSYVGILDEETLDYENMRAVLRRLELNSHGKLECAAQWELDWEPVISALDSRAINAVLTNACVANGRLVGNISDFNGREYIAVFDYDEEECQLIPSYATVHCPYADGKVLISECDYDAPDAPITFSAFDPVTDNVEPLCQVASENYYGVHYVAYDSASDTLFYALNGTLYRVSVMDPDTLESICPVWSGASYSAASLAFGGEAFVCAGPGSVAMYDVTVSLDSVTLDISDPTNIYSAEYYDVQSAAGLALMEAHPGVVVRMVDAPTATEAMLTRSSDVDIYMTFVDAPDYDALYGRGYMAELDGSDAITSYVSEMYPEVQSKLTKDGHIFAVPISFQALNPICYHPLALAELGLTESDMPSTWLEFLRFLPEVMPLLDENGVVSIFPLKFTPDELRERLFECILDEYMLHMHTTGQELRFDTPLMRSIIREFENIDFSTLGLPEDDSGYIGYSYNEVLFDFGISISPLQFHYTDTFNSVPLIMPLDDGVAPLIPAQLYVAFVNPYSENTPLAIEYLELIAANRPAGLNAALIPGNDEPVPAAFLEEEVAWFDEMIAQIESEMAKAPESELEDWEKKLEDYKEGRDALLSGDDPFAWDISADSVAWYRSMDDLIRISPSYGMDTDANVVFYSLRSQYLDGQITADEFIETADKRLNMMMLEAQ